VLEGEVNYAIGSAMALTSFSNLYMGSSVNKFFSMNGGVTVNTTIQMEENPYTKSEIVKRDIKRKLIEVIQARANNIGNGNLYVAGPFNPIPGVEDFNECSEPEYNDCGDYSHCVNFFGGFACRCLDGYGDRYSRDIQKAGRHCEACPSDHCNARGQCSIVEGERLCDCTGNFYGDRCQLDGEVLAVAIGASAAAVIIIILTLICLCMWSRRWKKEQQKTDLGHGFPRSYMVGTLPPVTYAANPKVAAWGHQQQPYQQQPYQQQPSPAVYQTRATMDPGLRWTQHFEGNPGNIYAQPVVFSGGPAPMFLPPGHHPNMEPIYMTPPEPPMSVYGTLPRKAKNLIRVKDNSPLHSHYATFRKEKLGPRVSLKSLQQKMAGERDPDTISIISGKTENSDFNQGVSFNRLPPRREGPENSKKPEDDTEPESSSDTPEPSSRLGVSRGGPLPSIPRPNTSLGTRGARQQLIESSESDDTETQARRPRSSASTLMAGGGNMTEDDMDADYYRYETGTVGVRNPRLMAQMRPGMGSNQHIQMNMMGVRW